MSLKKTAGLMVSGAICATVPMALVLISESNRIWQDGFESGRMTTDQEAYEAGQENMRKRVQKALPGIRPKCLFKEKQDEQ